MNIKEVFEESVIPEPNSGCWLWTGVCNRDGYGQFNSDGAHRASFSIYRGPIPLNMCVCHHCDTPCCVNPDHLFIGTQKENIADRHTKGRSKGGSLPGDKNRNSKLTPKQVIAIREDARIQKDIANDYGISFKTVSKIKLGQRWGWLS